MLRELIIWILNTYLGKYLENFNSAQISVAMLSGEVELENLPIRKDALRFLGIPIQVFTGVIGKIKLEIPVRQFRTSPWCISIEHLYCVFGPKDLNNWDDIKERSSELDFKLSALDALEAQWRSEKGCQMETYYSSSYNVWLNYGTNLATNIIDNIELKISDVHFRYEDQVTISNYRLGAGVRIGSLTAQSCDSNWTSGKNKVSNQTISYKLIELEDLSLYWDNLNDDVICQNFSTQELLENFNTICGKADHCFIVDPLSAKAKWKREKCKEIIRSKNKPRISCEVLVPEVKISFTAIQHERILECLDGLQKIKLERSNRLNRPKNSVTENPRVWWKYAIRSHGFNLKNEGEKWLSMQENVRYVKICRRIFINPNENLSNDDKNFKMYIENERNLPELQILRHMCLNNLFTKGLPLKAQNTLKRSMLFHWFPNWMGWYGYNSSQNTEQDESFKTFEEDILNALEDSLQDNSILKHDAVFGNITILLLDGQVSLCKQDDLKTDNDSSLVMQFKKLSASIETNILLSSYTLGISLGSIYLIDKVNKLTEFPYLIRPQMDETLTISKSCLDFKTLFNKTINTIEPLFKLLYESNIGTECRLTVKSKSLDIVYNREAFQWLINILRKPYEKRNQRQKYSDKSTSREHEFLKNWKEILTGHKENRKMWYFETEIFAPRIIIIENYRDKNSQMVLLDFGKFLLIKNDYRKKNCTNSSHIYPEKENQSDSINDDEEMYMTPCSTPPGSEEIFSESPTPQPSNKNFLNENTELGTAFHNKMYDKYTIHLTNLQVLVCKNQESWQASLRNSSNFHLLDKFNISLQVEQRIVFTTDPGYPSVVVNGKLSKILIHANEKKINDFFNIMYPITSEKFFENTMDVGITREAVEDEFFTVENEADGYLAVIQIVIDQVIIEIQSNHKSIAELQINLARACINKKINETHFTMSVHGLLLVDAIQSFGPDFELLAASHRQVGMDSLSGSLKQSAPCSPISSESPDSSISQRPTSPQMENNMIRNLKVGTNISSSELEGSNALISIEMRVILTGEKNVRITNIAFNNLDIIANQQTIIELMDFIKRTVIDHKMFEKNLVTKESKQAEQITNENHEKLKNCLSDINFDFYRLNILILHAVKRKNCADAIKIGTLTISEAQIRVISNADVSVIGSLGGIRIIDLTPDGINHQRIFSVGKDPIADPLILQGNNLVYKLTSEMYNRNIEDDEYNQINALNFKLHWDKITSLTVKVRMASMWYTHCPRFIQDVNVCITQFHQSFRKFLTSIRNKATYMAKEIVQQIKDVHKIEKEEFFSNLAPKIAIDLVINSPVILLPLSNDSPDVLVANLGKMSIKNLNESQVSSEDALCNNKTSFPHNLWIAEKYAIDIRNINLLALNTITRKVLKTASKPEVNFCDNNAVPILYDTAISLQLSKGYERILHNSDWTRRKVIWVEGSVTQDLKVSLSKRQHEQLMEALKNATKFSKETDNLVLFENNANVNNDGKEADKKMLINLQFSVPFFEINLQNEFNDTMIYILFHEFKIIHRTEGDNTEFEVFLRSVLMEDLKCGIDSPFRIMVNSSNLSNNKKMNKTSSSCPNFRNMAITDSKVFVSMPSILNCKSEYNTPKSFFNGKRSKHLHSKNLSKKQLVIYKSQTTKKPQRNSHDKLYTTSSFKFNCLNLTVSVDRWLMILDFFGLVTDPKNLNQEAEKKVTVPEEFDVCNKLEVSIQSLNVTLIRNETEISKVNISNVEFTINKDEMLQSLEGRLGSITLLDLTKFGHLCKQKLVTTGSEAMSFTYERLLEKNDRQKNKKLEKDAELRINLSSAIYIHTKRFIVEMHLFFKELLQLQTPVLLKLKTPKLKKDMDLTPLKIGLNIKSNSPIIVLPASNKCDDLLIVDLGKLYLKNSFCMSSDKWAINETKTLTSCDEVLDVMNIDLDNVNIFAGERVYKTENQEKAIKLGTLNIIKRGENLFDESCHLNVQVERNLNSSESHNRPDISVKALLSKLNVQLNIQHYRLIKGVLNNNFGEDINEIYQKYAYNLCESIEKLNNTNSKVCSNQISDIWNVLSISILLEDVSILLTEQLIQGEGTQPLSFIHFNKSTLQIDSLSEGSQDIDLISSSILIMDARKSCGKINLFKKVLQPSKTESKLSNNPVQAEIHCRKRAGVVKYTVLLNNMRLIAILDFLERLKKYLLEESISPVIPLSKSSEDAIFNNAKNNNTMEFTLNITDSEIVLVEDISREDTNAIILKSTTVFSFKPCNKVIPLSVNINHLEIFSCTMDAQDESALSIIDPCTLNVEIRNNCINFLIQKRLSIRLSYNDIKLFTRMIRSLPKQTSNSQNLELKSNLDYDNIATLVAMGFELNDCCYAMQLHNHKLNDAALWLSQQTRNKEENVALNFGNILLNANCISICIIDDCMDADVPLLEISFLKTLIRYKCKSQLESGRVNQFGFFEGNVDTEVSMDYYNRRLSGWEPIVESWECSANWNFVENEDIGVTRLNILISSKQLLKINITSTFIELFKMVCQNWTKDFYAATAEINDETKGMGFRRRSPFVPFALKNLTGIPLLFKPIYAQPGGLTCKEVNQQDLLRNWLAVEPNETLAFDFSQKSKLRHMDSHKLNLHQIMVQIHGWALIDPISIDKVGVFFRFSTVDCQYLKRTRIVFDISLFGSAQKLITVRSALNIINKLDRVVSLKMKLKDASNITSVAVINPDSKFSVPIKYVNSAIYIKHNSTQVVNSDCNTTCEKLFEFDNDSVGFGTREISWTDCTKDCKQIMYSSFDLNKKNVFTLVDIFKDKFPYKETNILGHTITLLPPLKLNNMLCCDLIYKIGTHIFGRINSSEEVNIYNVNIHESFNLSITLDNYKLSGQLKIPMGHIGIVEPKIKLTDISRRELYLRVSIQSFQGKGIEIYVSAPIWIINKSGLPLLYKQEGTNYEASGQFDEHEKARQVAPLMFSFSDQEGSLGLEVRLGNSFGERNSWCKSFNMNKNVMHRELKGDNTKKSFIIGINIMRGRGLYSSTTFVTISPRFQIHNKTNHKLEFAQKCDVSNFGGENTNNIFGAPVDSSFPFHWPNCDCEPLLCVRIADIDLCCWSKAIPINEVQSLYVNIRNEWGEMFFLRLEIIQKEATYILLFSDARTLPPPIRIDNYSEVFVSFSQVGNTPIWQTAVRPQSSLAYVMDDPLGSQALLIEAPGGNITEFPINKFDITKSLTYSNFIYIAFRETFGDFYDDKKDQICPNAQELVLGVKDRKVIIMTKNSGDRSQLWLMNSCGQLEHEGSSPPTQSTENNTVRLVLDLEKPPNPTEYTNLVVRPPNKQRLTTQTWRFENGRLMCHASLCVQSRDGLYGMRFGCEAVLGRVESTSRLKTFDNIPFEQCIIPQKLRPGSGQLEVTTKMDGPICTIQIHDIKNKQKNFPLLPDFQWNHASLNNKTNMNELKKNFVEEFSILTDLPKGIGISIIIRNPCEELAYISLENIKADVLSTHHEQSLNLDICNIQVDNQLLDTTCPVVFYSSKNSNEKTDRNALNFKVKVVASPNKNAIIFKYLTCDLKPCVIYLEEKFILKAACFLGFGRLNNQNSNTHKKQEVGGLDDQFLLRNSKRYYFENFSIGSTQVRLSVVTTSKLPLDLLYVKKSLGLTLIKFEDALIEFDKFLDQHNFETMEVYLRAMRVHYTNQIKWHAASILGSVDILGNPLGFANDLSEGVSGLIFEGSVKSLVKNVTHGISNSTAKLTETLSDSLGRVVLDDHDNETRQKILELQSYTSGGHLAAGLKGFGFGLLGGVTSIVRHTYDGAQTDGIPGFLSGLGKGIIGTVTKPIIGVLDLASETANAVRESSRGSHRSSPDRKRLPRCVTGAPGDLLPPYSFRQSKGQQYLHTINRRNFSEELISYEPSLCNDKEARLRLLVSTESVRIFSLYDGNPAVMFECHLSEVLSCHPLITNNGASTSINKAVPSFYIEISTNSPKITRPRIRCQSEDIAESASRCINYAKSVYDEREHSLLYF